MKREILIGVVSALTAFACGSSEGTRTGPSPEPPPVQEPPANAQQAPFNANAPLLGGQPPPASTQALPAGTDEPSTPVQPPPPSPRCNDICSVLSGACVSLGGINGRCAGVVSAFLTCALRAGYLCNDSGRIDPQNVASCVASANNAGDCLGSLVDNRGGS
jgi:hypothetical protein